MFGCIEWRCQDITSEPLMEFEKLQAVMGFSMGFYPWFWKITNNLSIGRCAYGTAVVVLDSTDSLSARNESLKGIGTGRIGPDRPDSDSIDVEVLARDIIHSSVFPVGQSFPSNPSCQAEDLNYLICYNTPSTKKCSSSSMKDTNCSINKNAPAVTPVFASISSEALFEAMFFSRFSLSAAVKLNLY